MEQNHLRGRSCHPMCGKIFSLPLASATVLQGRQPENRENSSQTSGAQSGLRLSAIDVRRVVALRGELGDQRVGWREVAYRVGRPRVAGEREGLAPAAAEILLPARAARARLLHPGG